MIEIDKYKEYESHGYRFRNFLLLADEEKRMVLDWRNHEKVRSMMVNKDIIPLENHLRFIESLKDRVDCYYWLVFSPDNSPIGVLDLLHVDKKNDIAEFGNYLNPDEAGRGFEFLIECNYFLFGQMQLGYNVLTVNVNNKETLLFIKYTGGNFERIEEIDGDFFYVNHRAKGNYIVENYDKLTLLDYARFVRKNRNSINFNV